MSDYINNIYHFCISSRKIILTFFKFVYFGAVIFIISALLLAPLNNTALSLFYAMGKSGRFFGDASLLLFVLTLLPGIGERVGMKNKFLSIVKIYRKQIGILMYFFALLHFVLSRAIFIRTLTEFFHFSTFEIMGAASLLILFFLFITSNTASLIRLKLNWYRIHRFIYIGMFSIFLHVALQGLSVWTVLMGLVLIFQIVSFVIIYRKTGSFTGGKPL